MTHFIQVIKLMRETDTTSLPEPRGSLVDITPHSAAQSTATRKMRDDRHISVEKEITKGLNLYIGQYNVKYLLNVCVAVVFSNMSMTSQGLLQSQLFADFP